MAVARNTDSLSPPPQPAPTKRDVRRNRMMEKLQHMIDSFTSHQHQHYRAQLQAIQVDMSLILRSDPYDGIPLQDGQDDIRALVESMGASLPSDEAAQRDFWALAGSRYGAFIRAANDDIEQRDSELVALHNRYRESLSELERLTQQKLHQAEEEHKALSNTIRQRLITTISKRRQQLLRDKEQLDIADSNALLLHPSHFTLNNPGSPSNGQNRKTRHLRHRATSPGATDEKRKRKAAALEDDGNESPAPAFRPLPPPDNLGGGRSPFKDARDKNVYTQFEAPAYSLERIFTDKELALATDTARMATYRYFYQQQQGASGDTTANTNGTTNSSSDGDNATGDATNADYSTTGDVASLDIAATGTPPPSSAPPAAPEMERTTSHQPLTRGHARANPLAALSDLATVAAAASGTASAVGLRENPFAPVVPNFHAVTRSEKSGAPPPSAVSALDTENDFEMIRRAGGTSSETGADPFTDTTDVGNPDSGREIRQSLLDQALGISATSQPYRLPLLDIGPAVIGRGVDRVPGTGFAPVPSVALEQRLRAQVAGAVAAGSTGGSLAAALRGGEAMSRTTSAAGSDIGELGPVRGRRRAGM